MTDDKMLFAAPTEEELFAAPTEADSDLFAAPSEDELFSPSEELPESPSKLKAAILGFGEGASFGLTPILGGVASAVGEAASDVGDVLGLTTEGKLEKQGFDVDDKKGLEGLLEAYYEGRDRQKEAQEKAFDETPYSYGAGLLGGSLAGGGAGTAAAKGLAGGGKLAQTTSKVIPRFEDVDKFRKAGLTGKIGMTATEGLKAGALAGLGTGEARLLEGDVEGTLEEAAAGGLGGAVIGGALTGLGQGLGKAGKSIKESDFGKKIKAAYKYGKTGKSLTEDQVDQDIEKLGKTIYNRMQSKMSKAGATKADILNTSKIIARDITEGTPVTDAFDNALTQIRNLDEINDSQFAKIKNVALDYLEELKGTPKELKKLEESVETARLNKMLRDVRQEADIKLQKRSDIESIKRGRSPDYIDETIQKSDNMKRGNLEYRVRDEDFFNVEKRQFPSDLPEVPGSTALDELGEDEIVSKAFSKRRVADATPFDPTEVKSGIDPETKRPFAAFQDKGTGRILGKVGSPLQTDITDLNSLDVKGVERLRKLINKQTEVIQDKGQSLLAGDKEILNISKQLAKDLKDVQETMLKTESALSGVDTDLVGPNSTIKNIKEAMDVLKIDSKTFSSKTSRIRENTKKLEMMTRAGGQSGLIDKRNFIRLLKEADPTYGPRLEGLVEDLGNLSSLVKGAEFQSTPSLTGYIREVAGGPTRIAGKAANVAGQTVKEIKGIPSETLRRLSPESYDTLSDLFRQFGRSDFANVIKSMAGESEQRRSALLFSLYQQPEFRKMLQGVGEGLLDVDTGE
jgi:hypothetical protein